MYDNTSNITTITDSLSDVNMGLSYSDTTNELNYTTEANTLVYNGDMSGTTNLLHINNSGYYTIATVSYSVCKLYNKERTKFKIVTIPSSKIDEVNEYIKKYHTELEISGYVTLTETEDEMYKETTDINKEIKVALRSLGYEIDLKSFIDKVRKKRSES